MSEKKATNITWHPAAVRPEDRGEVLGQRGCVVWLTGLSGSGKSTIARAAERLLLERGHLAYVLDGDNVRHGLNGDLGFSPEERKENIRRIGEVAALFADAGVIVLVAFISPYARDRRRAREAAGAARFLEVFVDADLATCEERDPKGLYEKARAGEISGFTGISAPYEPPAGADLELPSGRLSILECAEALVERLGREGFLSPPGPSSSEGEGRPPAPESGS